MGEKLGQLHHCSSAFPDFNVHQWRLICLRRPAISTATVAYKSKAVQNGVQVLAQFASLERLNRALALWWRLRWSSAGFLAAIPRDYSPLFPLARPDRIRSIPRSFSAKHLSSEADYILYQVVGFKGWNGYMTVRFKCSLISVLGAWIWLRGGECSFARNFVYISGHAKVNNEERVECSKSGFYVATPDARPALRY